MHQTVPPEHGLVLLDIARDAVASAFGEASLRDDLISQFATPGASFVTLMLDGALRGCIGSLEAHRDLGEDVAANAMAAAFRDPRFAPLSHLEFARVKFEVSVLSAATPLVNDGEVNVLRRLRPGHDGVIMRYRTHSATFLPQVWSQLPDKEAFLRHLKLKAGISVDFWSPEIQLHRYTVAKFAET